MAKKITELVAEVAAPVAQEQGCTLWDVEYVREAGQWYLRLYLDKEGGVDILDCEAVSRKVSDLLDELDPIEASYIFEVSSAGAERPLKRPSDFQQFMGSPVLLKTYKPVNGRKEFAGRLAGYDNGAVELDIDAHDTVSFIPQTDASGSYGTLTLNADGSYSYTLNNNLYAVQSLGVGETLTDTFTYTVTDSHGAIGSNTLTVTIHGTNDAPTVAAAIASVAEDAQTTATGTLPTPLDMDTHDSVSFLAQTDTPGTYGTLTLNADGSYAYALDNTSPTVQGLGVGETLTTTVLFATSPLILVPVIVALAASTAAVWFVAK